MAEHKMPRAFFQGVRPIGICVTLLTLISHRDLLAFLLITVCSLGVMFNVYKPNAEPSWDGLVYHRVAQDYVRGGLSFKAINGEFIGHNQHAINYLHRPLFFFLAGHLHSLSGISLLQIYPTMNLVALTVGAFYIYKICIAHYGLPAILSIISACWMLVSPPVLILHQVIATPEPLVLCFTACSFYYFGLNRYWIAYLTLALATLSKASAVTLAAYFLVQLLYTLKQTRRVEVVWDISILAVICAVVLAIPYVLINHAAAFDPSVVSGQILDSNRGHVFMSMLFNFGVLWIPFAAYLPSATSAYRIGLVYLILTSCLLAIIGATDWWRIWFSILFVFVLPGAASAIRLLSKEVQGIMVVSAVALSIIILQEPPELNFDRAYSPDKVMYMWAAAIVLLSAAARAESNDLPSSALSPLPSERLPAPVRKQR
jgi:hypothetical protein